MPVILTYFDDPHFHDYPFNDPDYVRAYGNLAQAVNKRGAEFWIVRGPDTYKGDMTFSRGWKFVGGGFEEINAPIKGDLIYIKGLRLRTGAHDKLLNPAGFGAVSGIDKYRTYELFPDLFPFTAKVENDVELIQALNNVRTDKTVIKPVRGFGGKGVFIGTNAKILAMKHSYPSIVQEFVDTSKGIPGITPSYHDFRMIIMDGEIYITCLRIPQIGKLMSNVALGGTMTVVPPELRPQEALALVYPVDEKLEVFQHRLYSIDCGRDISGKWYIFELNDQPGLLTPEECGEYADIYYDSLAKYLVTCASDYYA